MVTVVSRVMRSPSLELSTSNSQPQAEKGPLPGLAE